MNKKKKLILVAVFVSLIVLIPASVFIGVNLYKKSQEDTFRKDGVITLNENFKNEIKLLEKASKSIKSHKIKTYPSKSTFLNNPYGYFSLMRFSMYDNSNFNFDWSNDYKKIYDKVRNLNEEISKLPSLEIIEEDLEKLKPLLEVINKNSESTVEKIKFFNQLTFANDFGMHNLNLKRNGGYKKVIQKIKVPKSLGSDGNNLLNNLKEIGRYQNQTTTKPTYKTYTIFSELSSVNFKSSSERAKITPPKVINVKLNSSKVFADLISNLKDLASVDEILSSIRTKLKVEDKSTSNNLSEIVYANRIGVRFFYNPKEIKIQADTYAKNILSIYTSKATKEELLTYYNQRLNNNYLFTVEETTELKVTGFLTRKDLNITNNVGEKLEVISKDAIRFDYSKGKCTKYFIRDYEVFFNKLLSIKFQISEKINGCSGTKPSKSQMDSIEKKSLKFQNTIKLIGQLESFGDKSFDNV